MNTLITSWMLSALSYDEDNIVSNVYDFLPHVKCRFRKTKNGDHFYGIVVDDKTGKFWIVNRGTDGDNFYGKFKSWCRNLRVLTSGDGIQNGFQDAGDRIIEEYKNIICNYDAGFVCGHSQGAGVAQYQLCLLTENFPNVKTIHGDVFAAPPTFNKIGFERFKKCLRTGKMSLDRYVVSGDPIDSGFFRNKNSLIFNGVDVGNEILLPEIIGYDLKVANVIKHSPRIYNAGLIIKALNDGVCGIDEIRMYAKIGIRIVN